MIIKEKAKFLNIILTKEQCKLFKQSKKPKPKVEEQKCDPKFCKFKEYLEEHNPYVPVPEPKHLYTIEMRQAVYSEEVFDLYRRYEKHVHKKDRKSDEMNGHLCSSPAYHPERDKFIAEREAPYDSDKVDEGRECTENGIYPGVGTYHFYHRIDGKLVGLGLTDLTNTLFNA